MGSDESLWYATYDGTWSGQTQIQGAKSSVGPSLAGVGNRLYAVWKGGSGDENLYCAYYPYTDGGSQVWSCQVTGQVAIPGIASSVGASVAEFKGVYTPCARARTRM